MTKVLSEGRHAGEFILSEANGQRSRAGAVILGPAVIRAGMVLKKVAATTDVVEHYVAGGAGEGDAIAIYSLTTITGENGAIAILNADCEVNGHCLEFFSGATDPQKVTVMAALATKGILVRN